MGNDEDTSYGLIVREKDCSFQENFPKMPISTANSTSGSCRSDATGSKGNKCECPKCLSPGIIRNASPINFITNRSMVKKNNFAVMTDTTKLVATDK